jgi:hypothetical protein
VCQDFLAVLFLAVLFDAVDFDAAVFDAVDFDAVVFDAVVLEAVVLRAGALFAALLAAVDGLDFLAVDFVVVVFEVADFDGLALEAADFEAAVFAVVDFAAVVFFAAADFDGVDFLAVDFVAVVFAAVVFLAVVFDGADCLVGVLFAAPALFATSEALGSLGSFLAPDTTALSSAPAVNFGIAVFLALILSPVRGLRTQRASRTRFSNDPKPVIATFSPRATSRVIVSSTDSNACCACLRLPSKRVDRVSIS